MGPQDASVSHNHLRYSKRIEIPAHMYWQCLHYTYKLIVLVNPKSTSQVYVCTGGTFIPIQSALATCKHHFIVMYGLK